MVDYKAILDRAVHVSRRGPLPPKMRVTIYQHAFATLKRQLSSRRPPLPDAETQHELRKFAKALEQIEADIRTTP